LIRTHPLPGEKGLDREAHISTEDPSSRTGARFPRAHEDDRRPQSAVEASRAWAQAHHRRLIQEHVMRAARLRRSGDIQALRTEGRSLRRAAFLARVRRTDRREARLAVTAPRTVGHAVERNRARRRVREAFRRAIDDLTVMTGLDGLDLLVTARAGGATEEFGALVAEASAVLREATA